MKNVIFYFMEKKLKLFGQPNTDDVLQNCIPETYIILLNSITPIN